MSNEHQQSTGIVPLDAVIDNDGIKIRKQSLDLRLELDNLMEYIQCHSHEESVSSFEERYLLLISSYPQECLQCAVLLTLSADYDDDSSLRLPIHLACDKNVPLPIIKSLLDADINNQSVLKADKWGDLPIHIACSRAAASSNIADAEYRQRLLEHPVVAPAPAPAEGANNNNLNDIQINAAGLNAFARRLEEQNINWRRREQEREREQRDATALLKMNETIEIIRLLLEADQEKSTLYVKDVYESLPLHTAVRYNAPVEVIQLLLDNDIHIKYNNGNNNNQNNNSAVVLTVNTLYTEGLHGQYPLTVACRSGNLSSKVLKILLEYDSNNYSSSKQTIFHKDNTGRLPTHVFLLRNKCPESLQVLLDAMIKGRILNVGLDIWKYQIKSIMIHSMNMNSTKNGVYERDFMTRDKLDIICTQFELLYEICIVLELIVWKISCFVGLMELIMDDSDSDSDSDSANNNNNNNNNHGNNNDTALKSASILTSSSSSSLDDILFSCLSLLLPLYDDEREKIKTKTAVTYKTNRRIVSGSEIIVPNILSFLEGEPIINIVKTFQSYGYFDN
jgi:hypothetical protein